MALSMALFDNTQKLEKANQGNEQITIRRGVEAISAQFDKDVALARTHESLSKLYQSIGMDILPADTRFLPLKELQQKVSKMLKTQSLGQFNNEVNQAYESVQPILQKIKVQLNKERYSKG